MTNKNINTLISIIPLIRQEKEEEVLNHIKEGNFDINEVTERGNNLLVIAINYGCLKVAQELIDIDKRNNTNIFSSPITEECKFIFNSIVEDEKKIAHFHDFFIKNDIKLYPDFNQILDYIIDSEVSHLNNFTTIEAFDILKKFFNNTKEDIQKIDPVDMIRKISKFNSPNLLKLYFNICEFEKLPIQEHPSFKLLKDVLMNPLDYFDFTTFTLEKVNYILNEEGMSKIKEQFEKINRSKDFAKYFKKNKEFTQDLNSLYILPGFQRNIHPQKEIVKIQNAIKILNNNVVVENPDKFLNYYLTTWPVYYFKEKTIKNNIVSKETKDKFEETLLKYGFNKIFINKDINIDETLITLLNALKEIEQIFNLKNSEIGNYELDLIFHSDKNPVDKTDINVGGSYEIQNRVINIYDKEKIKDRITLIIHEYTHYLQYASTKSDFNLKEIKELSKNWINYTPSDFSQYLFNDIKQNHSYLFVEKENSVSDNFFKIIEEVISSENNTESALQQLNKKIQTIYSDHIYINAAKDVFTDETEKINLYYETQKNKEISFEYASWLELEKTNKKGYDYWIEPLEIHARLNEAIYEEKNKQTYNSINPLKLTQMKEMIKGFNDAFVIKLKEKNQKIMNRK